MVRLLPVVVAGPEKWCKYTQGLFGVAGPHAADASSGITSAKTAAPTTDKAIDPAPAPAFFVNHPRFRLSRAIGPPFTILLDPDFRPGA